MIENNNRRKSEELIGLFSIRKWILFVILLLPAIAGVIKMVKFELYAAGYPVPIAVCNTNFSKESLSNIDKKFFAKKMKEVKQKNIILNINTIGSPGVPLLIDKNNGCNDMDMLFLLLPAMIVTPILAFVLFFVLVTNLIPGAKKDWKAALVNFSKYAAVILFLARILFFIKKYLR